MPAIHLTKKLNKFLMEAYKHDRTFLRSALTEKEISTLLQHQLIEPVAFENFEISDFVLPNETAFRLSLQGQEHLEELKYEKHNFWQMSLHDWFVAIISAILGASLAFIIPWVVDSFMRLLT